MAIKGLFLGYHVHSGGVWSGDYEVAELESFLDNPGCVPREAKKHRTSRVEFHPNSMVFPIREAIDSCERRAERCKNLYDVINSRGEKAGSKPGPAEATSNAELGEDNARPAQMSPKPHPQAPGTHPRTHRGSRSC